MRRQAWVVIGSIVAVASAGCASDGDTNEQSSSRLAVTALAGGGDESPSESGTPGTDAQLTGRLTDLTAAGDGSVWAVLGGESLVDIDDEGDVRAWTPELPAGAEGVADLAVGGSGEIFVLLDGTPADAAVHAWDADTGLRPAFGRAVAGEDLGDSLPESPDGTTATDAPVGPIDDITVDDAGRVVFVEKMGVDGYRSPRLIRHVDDDRLATIAGAPVELGAEQPSTEEVRAASFPDDTADATSTPVLGPTLLTSTPDGGILLQFVHGAAILHSDGTLEPTNGTADGDTTVPTTPETGPLTDPGQALQAEFRSTTSESPSVSADGGILAPTTGGLPSDDEDRTSYLWDLQDGTEDSQNIAVVATTDPETEESIVVTHDSPAE